MTDTLILVGEGAEIPEVENGIVVHWSKMSVAEGEISLPELTNKKSDQLKSEYLNWVHELGEFEAGGKTIAQHLMIADNLSAWWMSIIAEKSPMKSRAIFDVLKLRSFELLQLESDAKRIVFCGSDPILANILQEWSVKKKLKFQYYYDSTSTSSLGAPSLGRRFRFLPHPLQAVFYFFHKWFTQILPARAGAQKLQTRSEENEGTIVTFFPNLDQEKLENGEFRSNYWQDLHAVFDARPEHINWVWLFSESRQMSLHQSRVFRDQLNAGRGKDQYFLVQEFLGAWDIFRIFGGYFRLLISGFGLTTASSQFCLAGSGINFFPAMEADWKASLRGIAAIEAVMYNVVFDKIARRFSSSAWVMHTFENQPWEQAHMSAFRRHGSAAVIAHQHEAIKSNNFRLFSDPEKFKSNDPSSPPRPDVLAVGGEHALKSFVDSGYPAKQITVLEAPRLQSLGNKLPVMAVRPDTLLVICGYLVDETRHQLGLLAEVAKGSGFDGFSRILIKGHPFLPVQPILDEVDFKLECKVTVKPLAELWPETGIAYLANSTAAVIEAVFAEIPSIVCSPYDDLDYCPVAGISGIHMVASPADLAEAIKHPQKPEIPADFIVLDPSMRRWEKLISEISISDSAGH